MKGKVMAKAKGKKRWAKHGSCLTNPDHKKFREAATINRAAFKPSGPSALTEERLQDLQVTGDQGSMGSGVRAMDMDAVTFQTWCTNFTDCTNLTFSRAHKLLNNNTEISKHILSLLATLTEVIKEKGGTGTEAEYFAGLLSMLDREDEEDVAAAAVLMDMAVRKIRSTTLRGRFSMVSKALTETIVKHAQTDNTTLLKHMLRTLAVVLKAQEAASWNSSNTGTTFRLLLQFTLSTKPRVRKTARQSVRTVLTAADLDRSNLDPSAAAAAPSDVALPVTFHPAATPTAEFCISTIKQSGKQGATDMDGLHVLNLLQEVLFLFPPRELKSSCETLLQFMFINKPVIKSNALAALHSLFEKHPPAKALPADLNSKIINALYDCQPTENDGGLMPAWLAVMEQAHINLHRLDGAQCMGHLPRLFSVGMKCLLADHRDIQTCTRNMMNLLLKECVGEGSSPERVGQLVGIMEGGLSFQYSNCWTSVLPLLATLMEAAGKIVPDALKKVLQSLAGLRDSHSFGYKGEVDMVLGKAVRVMGPGPVLQAVPLRITGTEDNPDLSRSWLLPVLRDNISHTQLSFFASYFLPLAAQFRTKGEQLMKEGREAVSKTYAMLELQLWSLLKGFCTCPTDLAKSFKGKVAMQLGTCLKDRPDVQMDVMAALRSLVTFSKDTEGDKAAMARLAQNYLPLLFNVFTAEPEVKVKDGAEVKVKDNRGQDLKSGHRLAALETVKVYLSITDGQLIHKYMDTCSSLMGKDDTTAFKKIALMDLLLAMVKYADLAHLTSLYSLAEDSIQSSDRTIQKKGYRVLEEIAVCQSDHCRQFLSDRLQDILRLLLGNESLAAAAPSTKNPRLRCLSHVCEQLREPNTQFIQTVLPEAMLCTRGCGERARSAAYHLIDAIGSRMLAWNPDQPKHEVLDQYVSVVLAGLSGSPQMVCSTLLALTRITSTYTDSLSGDTLTKVVQIVCQLLTSPQREIVRAALDFVKIFIGIYQRDLLCAHLSDLVVGISSMKETTRRPCHVTVKQIFRKLIKKFGYEAVQKLASSKVQVVLQKAHSEVKQDKKKKEKMAQQGNKDSDDDGDDDDDGGESVRQKPETLEEILQFSDDDDDGDDDDERTRKGKHQRSAFIVEGGGEVVDILDQSAARKVMASKPKSRVESVGEKGSDSAHSGFKTAPDGRLIITDADDKGERLDSEDEDLDDMFTMLEGGSDKKRRKRLREAAQHEDDGPQKKYKPGGSGIHRPLDKKDKDYGAEYRSKKGAGDVKKAGKHDPYTYVPLEFKNLNKRKQAKLQGQFTGLVQGARKGALKGMQKSRTARKAALKHAARK